MVILLRLWVFARPVITLFLVAFLASIGSGMIDAGFLALVKISIDRTYADYHLSYHHILLLLFIAILARTVFSIIAELGVFRFGRKIVMGLRIALYQQLVGIPVKDAEQHSTGELATKLIYHTEQLGNGFLSVLQSLLQEGVVVLAITAALFYINWRLTLILFLTYPIIGISIKYAAVYMNKHQSAMQNNLESIAHFVDETRLGIKTICMQNVSEKLKAIYQSMVQSNTLHQFKINQASTLSSACSHFMVSLPIIGLIWLMLAFPKYVTQGDIAAIIIGMTRIYQPVKRISKINVDLQSAIVAGESLFRWLDIHPERLNGKVVEFKQPPKIVLKNVSMVRTERPILQHVSLTVESGQIVAFAGESGSGKSSLILAITGLVPVDKGRIRVGENYLDQINLSSWRHQIGYVDQILPLFNLSIAENIAFFKPLDVHKLKKAAYIAGLNETDFEDGFEQMVDYGGHNLSNGQKQRIVLARAIYHANNILIIDEATSALDQETESKVYRRIKEQLPEMTVILTSHRPAGLQFADRIYVISKGRIVEQGDYESLMKANDHLAQIMEHRDNESIT
ncbi:MAG: hypothetical protein CMF42_02310 [Legionellales bacterium]|nr:hypothetical protein [Legionellales bacterium]|tara:strand:+ start:1085 stop:2788 length:1704 start_codon:yes stop_codon:yes gene_type:complete